MKMASDIHSSGCILLYAVTDLCYDGNLKKLSLCLIKGKCSVIKVTKV